MAAVGGRPISVCVVAGCAVGWLAWSLGWRWKVVIRNIARHAVVLDLDEAGVRSTARAHYVHLGIVLAVLVRLHTLNVEAIVSTALPPKLLGQLERGGVIICSAHVGLWELVPLLVARSLSPRARRQSRVAFRPLHSPAWNAWLCRQRGAARIPFVPAKGSWVELVEALARGGVVGLMADHRPRAHTAVRVPFLGGEEAFEDGLSRLHAATRAPVWFISVLRSPGWALRADVRWSELQEAGSTGAGNGVLAWYAGQVERAIRQAPSQYYWVHDRWAREDRTGTTPRTPSSPVGSGGPAPAVGGTRLQERASLLAA